MRSSPHQVYECSKVRVLLVGTTCSSWPLKTARSASGPAAVTTHAFVPYALATAAAYAIAPPCFQNTHSQLLALRYAAGKGHTCPMQRPMHGRHASTICMVPCTMQLPEFISRKDETHHCLSAFYNVHSNVAHKQQCWPTGYGDDIYAASPSILAGSGGYVWTEK